MSSNPPPLPTIEEATVEFRNGVTAALRAWSALRTAVQSEWGGIDSRDKAEYLRNYLFESLDYKLQKPKLDIDDLEDHLAHYMEEEFSIVLEDESERQVSQLIWQLYQSCGKGDYTLSRQIVSNSSKISMNEKVSIQCDSDDSDDEMEGTLSNNFGQDYLFGVPQSEINKIPSAPKPRQPKPEPIVDDDGFTMVTKRK